MPEEDWGKLADQARQTDWGQLANQARTVAQPVPGMEKLGSLPGVPVVPQTGRQADTARGLGAVSQQPSPDAGGWVDDYVVNPGLKGLQRAGEGIAALTRPGVDAKAAATHDIIGGVGEATSPYMAAGALINPMGAARMATRGLVTGTLTSRAAQLAQAPQGVQDLAGDLGTLYGAGRSARNMKANPITGPRIQATAEAAVKGAASLPSVTPEGKVINNHHLSTLDRVIRGTAAGKTAWDNFGHEGAPIDYTPGDPWLAPQPAELSTVATEPPTYKAGKKGGVTTTPSVTPIQYGLNDPWLAPQPAEPAVPIESMPPPAPRGPLTPSQALQFKQAKAAFDRTAAIKAQRAAKSYPQGNGEPPIGPIQPVAATAMPSGRVPGGSHNIGPAPWDQPTDMFPPSYQATPGGPGPIEQPVGGWPDSQDVGQAVARIKAMNAPQAVAGPIAPITPSGTSQMERSGGAGTGNGTGVGKVYDWYTKGHGGHQQAIDVKLNNHFKTLGLRPEQVTPEMMNMTRAAFGHAVVKGTDIEPRLDQLRQTMKAEGSRIKPVK